MTIAIHVDFGFKKDNAITQVSFGGGVITHLTANSHLFPNLPKSIADLQALNNELAKDVADVQKTDSKQARSNIKKSRKEWIKGFGLTGQYVDLQAAGVESTITAGGYSPTKNFRQKSNIPVASGFRAGTNGVQGSLVGIIDKPVPQAMMYAYYAMSAGVSVNFTETAMIVTVGKEKLFINLSTRRETEIYTLISRETFTMGVFAINTAGMGPSTPVQAVTTQ